MTGLRWFVAVTLFAALLMTGCGGGGDPAQPSGTDAPAGATPATDRTATLARVPAIYRRLEPSVVTVQVRGAQGSGEGSGVVYEERKIVTNHHVVAGAREIVVALASGERIVRPLSRAIRGRISPCSPFSATCRRRRSRARCRRWDR